MGGGGPYNFESESLSLQAMSSTFRLCSFCCLDLVFWEGKIAKKVVYFPGCGVVLPAVSHKPPLCPSCLHKSSHQVNLNGHSFFLLPCL
jgi:hypothetical protein